MYLDKKNRPPFPFPLRAIVLFLLTVILITPVFCGQHHFQHQARGEASSICASAMTLALTVVGSLLALMFIDLLVPAAYYLNLPAVYLPITKPPQ